MQFVSEDAGLFSFYGSNVKECSLITRSFSLLHSRF